MTTKFFVYISARIDVNVQFHFVKADGRLVCFIFNNRTTFLSDFGGCSLLLTKRSWSETVTPHSTPLPQYPQEIGNYYPDPDPDIDQVTANSDVQDIRQAGYRSGLSGRISGSGQCQVPAGYAGYQNSSNC